MSDFEPKPKAEAKWVTPVLEEIPMNDTAANKNAGAPEVTPQGGYDPAAPAS